MPRWGSKCEHVSCSEETYGEACKADAGKENLLEVMSASSSHHPPAPLRDMSCDDPADGYMAHKGCLFPITGGSDKLSASTAKLSRWSRNREPNEIFSEVSTEHVAGQSGSSSSRLGKNFSDRNQHRNERKARNRARNREQQNGEAEKNERAVVWLRDDMRLDDNPVLAEASKFQAVVCIYIHDVSDPSPWPLRGAALWWKYESLRVFSQTLKSVGSQLFIQAGVPSDILCDIALLVDADVVMWNRRCEPWHREHDLQTEKALELNGLTVRTFKAAVLWEPWEARPDERSYDRGFGSVGFYRSAVEELGEVLEPIPAVSRLPSVPAQCITALSETCLSLCDLGYHFTAGKGFPTDMRNYNENRQRSTLAPSDDWATDMKKGWPVGEQAAKERLHVFLQGALADGKYEGRSRFLATEKYTAILSPYIRFGEISSRRCYHEASHFTRKVQTDKGARPVNNTFARRFFWRDLAYWCLWRFPDMPTVSLRPHYETERWQGTNSQLRQWQQGRTGFPLVDAGMRQLWKLGWMPNYLRHVCAQFLIEFLDISWKKGFEWFDYTLVDSDVAINAFMWQNGGHSGLDQWNFVMHPVFAAKTCDPNGDYVRKWLPELRALPAEYIHCPWEAPDRLLLGANVLMNRTYRDRIIKDLDQARREHTREVLRLRNEHSEVIAKGGNEWFEARPGHWVTLITREDFKQNTEVFLTNQTADKPRHNQRRQLQDPLSIVMGDFAKHYDDVV